MRKYLKTATMLFVFTSIATILAAQEPEPVSRAMPRWISDKGYWVVESNIKTPDQSIIHFYNNDNVQVYFEKVDGIRLNVKKRKTLMRLKKALDESLLAFQKSHLSKDNVQLVSNIFKAKKIDGGN